MDVHIRVDWKLPCGTSQAEAGAQIFAQLRKDGLLGQAPSKGQKVALKQKMVITAATLTFGSDGYVKVIPAEDQLDDTVLSQGILGLMVSDSLERVKYSVIGGAL
jgi:hypothetical protein